MILVEVGVAPFPVDGEPAVVLQLPDGYVILRPEDAREVARMLTLTSFEAEE